LPTADRGDPGRGCGRPCPSGIGDNGGFNVVPLSAVLPVDDEHSYGLFVWCGVTGNQVGFGDYFWSLGWGEMKVIVPEITWHLF
jgi:hypothetical protein